MLEVKVVKRGGWLGKDEERRTGGREPLYVGVGIESWAILPDSKMTSVVALYPTPPGVNAVRW
jgi:hypothetical protein